MVLFRVRRLLVVLVLGGLLAGSRTQIAYAAFSLGLYPGLQYAA